ncbi:hypothetical protein DNAOFDDG_00949 [Mannheimia haemolytica]|uniref:Type V secretory pathway, adhesin AidA n=1 Tax=Mannheimia haemolytica TaxID=75985 RepID=A0A378NC81_MANHA|nr:ESPR domain-containing protein [Mannheimia haemolytica]EEY09910.1 hypothetical protein COI_1316 [Mannheimia haemolytica serotype A2 str. OVINE]MDW0534108.1 ESPR domain-containing protein [Mannheimia haemolytica]MDW0536712.1 ESPR domain-containing protein [Mannheimia haemolytica]MDW0544437.1 ESPR domain-containing protein [Mannheimia haemolytica]MDW0571143.1 ESPR domain-containing protein [Mannheimia haemolytica]
MNQIFKVIWNQATQSWVAVSELQRAKGKTMQVRQHWLYWLELVPCWELMMLWLLYL